MDIKVTKFQRLLAVGSYIGIVGLGSLLLVRKKDDEFLYSHVRTSSILFVLSLLIVPFLKLVNRYYSYYLASTMGLIAIFFFIAIIIIKVYCIIRAIKGLANPIIVSNLNFSVRYK